MNCILSKNEATRLKVLYKYQILDTSPEQAFDDLVFLAAQICATPIALINFIDAERQWFKAKIGLDMKEIPRDVGICPFCIGQSDILIILDTWADERFSTSPVVTSAPYVRFYAGVPLIAPEGEAIGTLCVVDSVPRQNFTTEQEESLKALARLVMRQLELRRNLTEVANIKTEYKQAQQALRQSESVLSSFFDSAPMMMGVVELLNDDILHISNNAATAKFFCLAPNQMRNCRAKEMGLPEETVRCWLNYYRQAERTQLPVTFEYPHLTVEPNRWLKATVSTIVESSTTAQRFAYIIEDITERKQSEETLRWKEALLRSMTGVSPLAFYVVDRRNGEILYFNERFCEIWNIEHLKTQMECGGLKHEDVIEVCCQFTDISPFSALPAFTKRDLRM